MAYPRLPIVNCLITDDLAEIFVSCVSHSDILSTPMHRTVLYSTMSKATVQYKDAKSDLANHIETGCYDQKSTGSKMYIKENKINMSIIEVQLLHQLKPFKIYLVNSSVGPYFRIPSTLSKSQLPTAHRYWRVANMTSIAFLVPRK